MCNDDRIRNIKKIIEEVNKNIDSTKDKNELYFYEGEKNKKPK